MNRTEEKYKWLAAPQVYPNYVIRLRYDVIVVLQAYVSRKNEGDKVVAYERAGLLFVFNFHPINSFTSYKIGVDKPGSYRILLNTDNAQFGGFSRIDESVTCATQYENWDNRNHCVFLYLPSRTAIVLGL